MSQTNRPTSQPTYQCTLGGLRRTWPRVALALGTAVGTYLVLYAITTCLGTFA